MDITCGLNVKEFKNDSRLAIALEIRVSEMMQLFDRMTFGDT